MVRNVAMSIAAQQVFIGYGVKSIHAQLRTVWKHSVLVATLSHLVATRCREIETEEAFLAGLLHEVGKLYVLIRAKDHEDLLANEAAFNSIANEWHPRIGAKIAVDWGFDPALAAAIADHESCSLDADGPITLTLVVAVANYLAGAIESSHSQDDEALIESLPTFGALNLDKQTIAWTLAVSADELTNLQTAFGA
jgi:putative nucleotidyltransferase with HDIG domain